MADDARTEARLRLIQALVDHRLVGAYCKCGHTPFRHGDHELHLADALLALFEHIEVRDLPGWVHGEGAAAARQLILTGPVEPVVPEEAQP